MGNLPLSSLGSEVKTGAVDVDFLAMIVKASAPKGPHPSQSRLSVQEIARIRKKCATPCRKCGNPGWRKRLQPLIFGA